MNAFRYIQFPSESIGGTDSGCVVGSFSSSYLLLPLQSLFSCLSIFQSQQNQSNEIMNITINIEPKRFHFILQRWMRRTEKLQHSPRRWTIIKQDFPESSLVSNAWANGPLMDYPNSRGKFPFRDSENSVTYI